MKLAIALFGTRISPRFDCAPELLRVTIENGEILSREKLLWRSLLPYARIAELAEMKVDMIICGAIDGISYNMLVQKGIRVYSWITGEAEKAVELFLKRELQPGMILMAGQKGRQWRCRKGARWRWNNFHP